MKDELKLFLKILLSAIGIFLIIFIFVYFMFPSHNQECIELIAISYCEENNMSFLESYSGNNLFHCLEPIKDERINRNQIRKRFYYLDSELDSCLIKEGWSFAKTNNSKNTEGEQ